MVFRKARKGVEKRGIMRVFDMRLDPQNTLLLDQLVHRELQAQQVDIGLLVVFRPLEQRAEHARHCLQHWSAIGNDECPDGGAQNDEEFEGLPQHLDMAAHAEISAEHAAENDEDTD
ncbi:hypothetical protein D9M69_715950 [compost metagenome]